MSANWGITFGESGWFGAGGGGTGSDARNGNGGFGGGGPGGSPYTRANSGGASGANGGQSSGGIILVKMTIPDPELGANPSNLDLASYLGIKLSGGSTNRSAPASLGGGISFYSPRSAIRNEIFPDVTTAQRIAGITSYRCLYLDNEHSTLTMASLTAWLEALAAGAGATFHIGVDPAGINGVAAAIANETTAPAGVSFSAPTSYGAGINLGSLAPGDYIALWLRRTIAAGATARQYDQVRLGLQFT